MRAASAIEKYANQTVQQVTLQYLLELEKYNIVESAKFIQKELPVRLAKRVKAIQNLPFIVGVNPFIKTVYQLYLNSFQQLSAFPTINTIDHAHQFTDVLGDLIEEHNDVIPNLAKGFQECGKYMSREDRTKFLDGMIHARSGLRMLAEHFLALQDTSPDWKGVVHTKLKPQRLLNSVSNYVREICEINYGRAPDFVIEGDINACFPYIPVHMEYISLELIKNAMRATVEHSIKTNRVEDPPVHITIAQGLQDITIRIRDQGGGISPFHLPRVFEYSFTTVEKIKDENVFAHTSRIYMQSAVGGPMAGLGFGLPMSRVYARYFGGSLELKSITNIGCDAFVRLPDISQNASHVHI